MHKFPLTQNCNFVSKSIIEFTIFKARFSVQFQFGFHRGTNRRNGIFFNVYLSRRLRIFIYLRRKTLILIGFLKVYFVKRIKMLTFYFFINIVPIINKNKTKTSKQT